MPFTLNQFALKRPYLFHLTDREHLHSIRQDRILFPASHILELADKEAWKRQKRRQHLEVEVDGRIMKIRDQAPLHEGNMVLSGEWTFADFIAHLNGRVFFWPGRPDGTPIDYGRRHYERYAAENPLIIRVGTAELLAANSTLAPEFCKYNSGSPRWTNGKASPRGPETFVACEAAPFSFSNVVEVTFPGAVALPSNVLIGDSPSGPWHAI